MARILIVEDDRPFAEALADALQVAGHEVFTAATAAEGVRLGVAIQPDLSVVDWFLRCDMHGGEVCRRLMAAHPEMKIILISGYVDIMPQYDRWSQYAAEIIPKPFHKEDILAAVKRILDGVAVPAI